MGKGTESCHWPNALALAGWLLNNRKMFVSFFNVYSSYIK